MPCPQGCAPSTKNPKPPAGPTKGGFPPKQKNRSVTSSQKSDEVTSTYPGPPLVFPIRGTHTCTHTHTRLLKVSTFPANGASCRPCPPTGTPASHGSYVAGDGPSLAMRTLLWSRSAQPAFYSRICFTNNNQRTWPPLQGSSLRTAAVEPEDRNGDRAKFCPPATQRGGNLQAVILFI